MKVYVFIAEYRSENGDDWNEVRVFDTIEKAQEYMEQCITSEVGDNSSLFEENGEPYETTVVESENALDGGMLSWTAYNDGFYRDTQTSFIIEERDVE